MGNGDGYVIKQKRETKTTEESSVVSKERGMEYTNQRNTVTQIMFRIM